MRCASCEAMLDVTDRFCPACGTPNVSGKLFPRFGPALREPPGVAPRPELGNGVIGCPRCGWPVAGTDPFCTACGMSLDGVHEAAARASFIGVWTTPGPGGLTPYRPIRRLGAILRVVLAVVMALSTALMVEVVRSLADADRPITLVRLDHVDLQEWTGVTQVGLLVAIVLAATLFVWWMARGYRNLPALGVRRLRIGPRWAVWSWFVPFVNLVVPKEAVDDLWRASDPNVAVYSPSWRASTVPFRIHLWWLAIVGAAVLLLSAEWALPSVGTTDPSISRAGLGLAAAAFPAVFVGGLLEWMLVADVGTRQARRFTRLGPVQPDSIGRVATSSAPEGPGDDVGPSADSSDGWTPDPARGAADDSRLASGRIHGVY